MFNFEEVCHLETVNVVFVCGCVRGETDEFFYLHLRLTAVFNSLSLPVLMCVHLFTHVHARALGRDAPPCTQALLLLQSCAVVPDVAPPLMLTDAHLQDS